MTEPRTLPRVRHTKCKHTRYDRLLIQYPHADRAEAWERLASSLYAREHPVMKGDPGPGGEARE